MADHHYSALDGGDEKKEEFDEENADVGGDDVAAVGLSYSIKDVAILQGTTCSFANNRTHGILGPSGAGKTTLLRCLIGDVGGVETGAVEVGGAPCTRRERREMSALVPQDDVLPFSLSAYEILRFTALLRGFYGEEATRKAREMIVELKLERCALRRVGDPSMGERGASGGERKRISIGVELLSSPSCLCADEPTSGLDSTAALDVALLMKEQQVQRRCELVIMTVHQPSWTLLLTLDTVTFLANAGRVAYSGPVAPLVDFFTSLGYPSPPNENAADVAMRTLQSPKDARVVVTAWEQRGQPIKSKQRRKKIHAPSSVPAWRQIWYVAERTVAELLNDRSKLMGVFGAKIIVGLVVGLVWLGLCEKPTNEAIYPTTSALFICVFNNTMETLFTTLLHVPGIKALLHREHQNSLYSYWCWFTATFMVLFVQQSLAAFLMTVPVYLMAGLRRDLSAFVLFLACQCLLSCVGAALGLAVGGCSANYSSARQKIIPTLMPLIIFAGYLVPYHQLLVELRWLYWVSLFQYGISISKILQWRGVVFTDCPPIAHELGACFLTGDEYLLFSHSDPKDLVRNFAYLGALLVAFLVLTFAVLRRVALAPAN